MMPYNGSKVTFVIKILSYHRDGNVLMAVGSVSVRAIYGSAAHAERPDMPKAAQGG
jgi:hypothetical protein